MNAGSADRAQWGEESGVAPPPPAAGQLGSRGPGSLVGAAPAAGQLGSRGPGSPALLATWPVLFLLRARVAPLVV
uniref:Uncharacterized protein n=1 Tax=Siphoviridae sp. ctZF426 TaxID=2827580 RepID=A0A8S5RTA1_9CAUD|nr:MAG TPA: hypothetical protein [Siphoviridae sp. ctZF426]